MNLHKLIITLFAILGLIFSIIAQNIPSYVPQNGLVAWYPFDGNANDESGNGNNGTVHNNVNNTSDRFNNQNSAIYINNTVATPNGVEIPSNSSLKIGNAMNKQNSISIWFKNDTLLGSSINGPTGTLLKNPITGNSTTVDFSVFLETNKLLWGTGRSTLVGGDACSWMSETLVNKKKWNHVVVTINQNISSTSGTKKIYINGALVKSCQYNFKNASNNASVFLGVGGYIGSIDDIGFWNRELTDNEIEGLYKACTGMPNASVLPLGSTTFCESDSVRLTSSIIGNYNYKWWRNNVELKGENSIFFTAKQEGSYSLSIDSFGCVLKSPSVIVKVNKLPIVQNFMPPFIHVEQTVFPLFGTPNGGSYSGLGVNGAFFNAKLAGLGRKNIVYTYTDTNLCRNTAQASTIVYDTTICSITVTDTLIINASFLSLNNQHVYTTIKIYPNPAQTHVFIDYENINLMQGFHLSILNTSGKEVHKEQIINNQSIIDLSKWSGKGLYIVNLYDNQNKLLESRKIVLN